MPTGSILFAEADPRALACLPTLFGERLPRVNLEICKTVDHAARQLRRSKFDTVVSSTPFLWAQDSRLLKDVHKLHTLVPLVLTVDRSDRIRAQTSFQTYGFDIITKPIESDAAVKTVRLALWQNRLLKLLTSRERIVSAFEQHMLAFPHHLKVEQLIRNALSTIDETLAAVHASKQRFEVSLDVPFYDLAVAVEARAREQALNRLLQLCPENLEQ